MTIAHQKIISLAVAAAFMLPAGLYADFNQAVKLQREKDYAGAEKVLGLLYA